MLRELATFLTDSPRFTRAIISVTLEAATSMIPIELVLTFRNKKGVRGM